MPVNKTENTGAQFVGRIGYERWRCYLDFCTVCFAHPAIASYLAKITQLMHCHMVKPHAVDLIGAPGPSPLSTLNQYFLY